MKKRSFRSTFVSVILVITVAISIVNLKRKIELDKIPVFIRQNKMIPMLTKIPENIEEKYENLDVILFCEDEIRDTYIDDGNVQNLKAKIEEG